MLALTNREESRLRIAITADPDLPVPPRHYGGIERIIDILVQELSHRGHDVTLFANRASRTSARLIPYPGEKSSPWFDTLRNTAMVTRHILAKDIDIVHSFSRLAYLLPLLPLRVPKLMTYQRQITARSIRLGNLLSRGTLHFTAIGKHMLRSGGDNGKWHYVPNCTSLKHFQFSPVVADGAPLMFLGRIEEIKGPHLAIEVAKKSGSKLYIAGNVPSEGKDYFESKIKPFIDGKNIIYVGPVDDSEKNRLLRESRALLMPVLWEEPFGIVMVEALACGTPIIALNRGAVPEIVEDGVNGFIRSDVDGLVEAVIRVGEIERRRCRERVERHFSADVVTEQYLSVYHDVIASCGRLPNS